MKFLGWLGKKRGVPGAAPLPAPAPGAAAGASSAVSSRQRGNAAEDLALAYLQAAGLHLLLRNYRTPGRGGGEIDLVLREPGGTLVFVEVRSRTSSAFGGAAASVDAAKRRRIVFAARHYLLRLPAPPPCRFDVVLVQPGSAVQWIRGAFDA